MSAKFLDAVALVELLIGFTENIFEATLADGPGGGQGRGSGTALVYNGPSGNIGFTPKASYINDLRAVRQQYLHQKSKRAFAS